MDFEEDIRAHVLSKLPHEAGVEPELATKSGRDLLMIYRNWLNRLVSPRPRIVHRSEALNRNPLTTDPAYQPAVEEIIRRIESGEDVTAFLSRGIRHGYRSALGLPRSQLGRRKDLDLLLNDWRVHHLHLSTEVEADGFVKRTGPLLFTVFQPELAYLIDIIDHGGWFKDHVLKVMVSEWPTAGLVVEIPAADMAVKDLSEEDRKALRGAGITTGLFEVDGKFYCPTSSLSTAGTSLQTMREVSQVFRDIAWFQNHLEKDPEYVSRQLATRGLAVPSTLDLHFAFFEDGGYGVIERNSNFRFRLRH